MLLMVAAAHQFGHLGVVWVWSGMQVLLRQGLIWKEYRHTAAFFAPPRCQSSQHHVWMDMDGMGWYGGGEDGGRWWKMVEGWLGLVVVYWEPLRGIAWVPKVS